jgi:hypothetical protein
MELATIIGSAGVVALLVGLVGGNFKFGGSTMPAVGRVARSVSFAVGGVLTLLAIGLATTGGQASAPAAATVVQPIVATSTDNSELTVHDSALPAADVTSTSPAAAVASNGKAGKPSASRQRTAPPSRALDAATDRDSVMATVVAAPGFSVAFLLPSPTTEGLDGELNTLHQLKPGTRVALECLVEGEALAPSGVADDIWFGVEGGYISDLWLTASNAETAQAALLPACS